MRENFEIKFENILEKLMQRFDSDPYSLSKSQIQMLKWFSHNPGYLGKTVSSPSANSLIRTGMFTAFVKKNLNDDKIE